MSLWEKRLQGLGQLTYFVIRIYSVQVNNLTHHISLYRPDQDKIKQEQAKASHAKYETGAEQASEFADSGERSNVLRDSNLAESGSVGPVEDVSDSEDFSKMKKCYKEDWMILRQNVKS